MTLVGPLLSTDAVTPSQKTNREFWHDLPLLSVSDHLLGLPVPWYCFQKDLFHDLFRHRGEAHWSSFLPFLKMETDTPFSSHHGCHLTAMTFQIWWKEDLQLHHPVPSGHWIAWHWTSWNCTSSPCLLLPVIISHPSKGTLSLVFLFWPMYLYNPLHVSLFISCQVQFQFNQIILSTFLSNSSIFTSTNLSSAVLIITAKDYPCGIYTKSIFQKAIFVPPAQGGCRTVRARGSRGGPW